MTHTVSTPSLFTRLAGMLLAAVLAGSVLSGCGYNEFQAKDEATKAAWGANTKVPQTFFARS